MFALTQRDHALFRGIATLLAVALVLYAVGTAYIRTAEAVNVTDVYDLLSTSATSTASNHTIEFVTPTGLIAGETILLTFDSAGSNFDLSTIGEEDIDVLENGVDQPDTEFTVATTSNSITITSGTLALAAGATTTILVGLHATNSGSPNSQIVNPATEGSYDIDIGGTMADSGATIVAIVDSVYVTASVATQFDFTVIGHAAAGTVNGEGVTSLSTANTIPFGELTNGVPVVIAQDLTVSTNAINGYVVTAEVDHQLESSTGADIDAFDEAVFAAPAAWNSPVPTIADENSWGHWGWTSEDTDTTRGAAQEFGANEWEGASTSPAVVMSHTGPADELTPGIGSTTVGFQVEITALQEAGDDYQAILTYIATPTF